MKAGYRKRAAKSDRLMDGGKVGGYSLSTLDRLDRATADEAAMVERCLLCPKWKFEGTAAECRGARAEHRRFHELVDVAAAAPVDLEPAVDAAARRERVLELRLAGWSQRAIALELGVSQRTVVKDLLRLSTGTQFPEWVTSLDGRRRPASRSRRGSEAAA